MPKASKSGYYAVRAGREPGIYTSWVDCEAQVKGFANAVYKKLNTEAEAIEYMAAARTSISRNSVPVPAAVSRPDDRRTRTVEAAEDEKDCDIVYCDGACKGNGQPGSVAGIGVWWGHGDPRNISERCPGDQTNNRAELIAIVRVLETTPHLKRRLLIKTDSKYSIQCVTSWIFNWMKNGFLAANGKPVKNRALIKYLAALLHARRKTSQRVEFKHVRGHVGIEGNEAADRLANLGATEPMVLERDWEKLEKQVLQSLKPVQPVKVMDDDLKGDANGLLSGDGLAGSSNRDVGNIACLVRESGRRHVGSEKHATRSHTLISAVPRGGSRPRVNRAGSVAPRAGDGISVVDSRRKSPSGGCPGPTTVVTRELRSVPSKKLTTAFSKEELEEYASCLLDDVQLSTLGKDGVFDSDF